MSVCLTPELLKNETIPTDVKERAERLLKGCKGGSVGAYTDSQGIEIIRQDIADFITRRDEGIISKPEDIYLTTGASGGIKVIS
jgi:alanine transaminase